MRVLIAGGHGKIALRLARLLSARGDKVAGIVRNPIHVHDVRGVGADAFVLDLEHARPEQVVETLRGVDVVVFAAGAGPGSGAARKDTVDRAAAVLMADSAQYAGVARFVQISSMGLGRANDRDVDPVFAAYLRAKDAAERDLIDHELDWMILRPGRLTDDPGTGRVTLAPPGIEQGAISRDDVAAVVLALLDEPASIRQTLELVAGPTPIAEAVAALRQ